MGRKVQVGDVVYDSIKQAAKVYNIAERTVRKRINSKTNQFKDWKWGYITIFNILLSVPPLRRYRKQDIK
jgi:hypothetical protein